MIPGHAGLQDSNPTLHSTLSNAGLTEARPMPGSPPNPSTSAWTPVHKRFKLPFTEPGRV
ncbi:hypothetical protein I79_024600 [Cricetulus griseus]|uniref:Uncharacterized protein n=1 Tax=Cricetulus griseus TaxID=10029 RepID=G3IL39_CRIGR|nr:hypothetical protein I79_024600 [Cricetulus griseus]